MFWIGERRPSALVQARGGPVPSAQQCCRLPTHFRSMLIRYRGWPVKPGLRLFNNHSGPRAHETGIQD